MNSNSCPKANKYIEFHANINIKKVKCGKEKIGKLRFHQCHLQGEEVFWVSKMVRPLYTVYDSRMELVRGNYILKVLLELYVPQGWNLLGAMTFEGVAGVVCAYCHF